MNQIINEISADIRMANILIVDDESANVRLIEKILKANEYKNIVCTQDPTKVLSLYKKHKFDLILLDINMPKLDGYAVMKLLAEEIKTPLPPILILTAQHAQNFRQQALDNGARDYVTKPFDMDELLSRVRNLLEVEMVHKYIRTQNQILEEKIQQRTKEIYETRLQVVRHLGRAAEYRDNETGLHIIRMSKMAAALGKAAGMSSYECELLLNASPMHDIGKIGIPDNILLKPGKLDADEWEIMKTHAQIGADILEGDDSHLMAMARDIALSHHEKWNGEGYPVGLKGEDIPFVGRITSIADVFDALTSERPYKQAWSVSDAVNLIIEERGKHFDPSLVDLFIEILPEIELIKEKYAEPGEVSGGE
jgi:cyclic di-GMP phosphodiesterase